MIRISIVGATGYTGAELIRWLLRHPETAIMHCTSSSSAGKKVSSIHTEFEGRLDLTLETFSADKIARDTELAFLCLPHAESARTAVQLLKKGVRLIDLSADFRLKNAAVYQKWYKVKHPAKAELGKFVYGLPEVYRREIQDSDRVANPGCYATASILGALPLVKNRLIKDGTLVIDAKSGVSGAGKKVEPRYLFCQTHENFLAYAVGAHRHTPEIEQELSFAARKKVDITFVPHLLPVNRGILATIYGTLNKKISTRELREIYLKQYGTEPFVAVLPEGEFPEIRSVQYTNHCHIGVYADPVKGKVIVISAIDNLGKGASSQAVQNMNLMFGLDEKTGLA